MYVVRKLVGGSPQWLSRASPRLVWGDKAHAMTFETRGLAQMAVYSATRNGALSEAPEIVFVPDPTQWRQEADR